MFGLCWRKKVATSPGTLNVAAQPANNSQLTSKKDYIAVVC